MKLIKDNFQHFFTLFLVIIFFSLGLYYFVHFGYYPVAIVNTDIISAKELFEEHAVAHRYYLGVLGKNREADLNSEEVAKELRRAALNNLIEQSLIHKELKRRVGRDLDSLIANKINISEERQDKIEEAAKAIYGIDFANFKQLILVPQAKKEILEGRLFLEKEDLAKWLENEYKNSKVFILTPEFYWASNRVELRE